MNSLIPNPETFREIAYRGDMGFGWLVVLALAYSAVGFLILKRYPIQVNIFPRVGLAPFGLAALAFLVRVPNLFDDFWYDETFTAAMVKLPLNKLPAAIMGDVHPPLPYLIEWFTAQIFGTSEIALRLPALAFGVLLVLLVFRLAMALQLNEPVAFWAGVIVVFLPSAIFYSTEARGYALLACLALGALISILENKSASFLVCAVLLPFTHNIGFVYLGVLSLCAVWFHRRSRQWFGTIVLTNVLGSLWLPMMLNQASDVSNGFWIPPLTLPGALWYIPDMTLSARLPAALILPTYIPMLMLTVFSLYAARHWLRTEYGIVLLALVFGVPLLVAVVSWVWRPVYLTRALLPCALALVILWAYLLSRYRLARWVMVPVFLLALLGYQLDGDKINLRTSLKDCEGATSAYFTGLPAQFMGAYYIHLPQLLWPNANDLNQSLTAEAKEAFGFKQGDIEQLAGRVCLVQVATPYSSEQERDYIAGLLLKYPHTQTTYAYNTLFHLYIYQLEL